MNYKRIVKELIIEVRRLRDELERERYASEAYEMHLQEKLAEKERQLQDAEYRAEQQRQDALYDSWEREDAMHDLEKAKRWNNSWGIARAERKLKRLL